MRGVFFEFPENAGIGARWNGGSGFYLSLYTREKKKEKEGSMARKGIRLKTPPAAPVPPDLAFCSAALPAWMYRDPADVVERMELQANARAERQQRERAQVRERTEEKGLSPQTVLQVRRLRIREMVKRAMEGK